MARSRRLIAPAIPSELKDKYFYIDYLRLHRYGKSNRIWVKNRTMLSREDQYNENPTVVTRKGYKSYVQRCLKSILDSMYPGFDIIKPRDLFGYEIGSKNDENKDLLDFSQSEDKIKLILGNFLQNGDNSEAVLNYRDAVIGSNRISFKNKESGLRMTLDENRSYGYQAVQEIVSIRDTQDRLLSLAQDPKMILNSLLVQGLNKAREGKAGERVQEISSGEATGRTGTIHSASRSTRNGHDSLVYEIEWDTNAGQGNSNVRSENMSFLFGADQIAPPDLGHSQFLERIINYANENFATSGGVGTETIFNLSRGAIVRELIDNGDVESARIAGQIEALTPTLERITVGQRSNRRRGVFDNHNDEYHPDDE